MTVSIPAGPSTYVLSSSGVTASLGSGLTRGSTTVGQGISITGSNDTLSITGTVVAGNSGGSNAAVAVSGGTGDSITNHIGGYLHGAQADSDGIYFTGGASGQITNAGIIASGGGGSGGDAVGINIGSGSVTNLSGGTISGAIYFSTAAGTVINSGLVRGDSVYGAIYLKKGGVITNLAGTIAANGAAYGIEVKAGSATVTNAATITGGSAGGSALLLASGYTNRVIVDPGGVFVGTVSGGTPSRATLELASGASTGTLNGFDSQYLNFGTLTFDPSSSWIVKASTSLSSAIIQGFGAGETIDLTGFTAATSSTISGNTGFVLNSGASHITLSFGSSLTSFAFTTGAFGTDVTGVCFRAGTHIATPDGETPVEQLRSGDVVLTAHNGPRAITWIGEGKVLATSGKRSAATPVIVRRGALGPGVPGRDLHVTKGHSLFLDEVLIPVEFLVNHRTILWDDHAREVHIFHIELETHDVLLAEGVEAESYRDDGNRWLFQNRNPGWGKPPQEPYAPILTGGAVVDAVWRRLLDRAAPRSMPPMTEDADLHLIADGECVEMSRRLDDHIFFRLARRPAALRLRSRVMVPAELGFARDPRCLGVAVRRISILQGDKLVTVRAHDRRLKDGFHDYEPSGDLRWTDGDAALPAEAFASRPGPVELVVHLGAATRYPVYEEKLARTG